MGLLERYQEGEFAAVYEQLQKDNRRDDEAQAVADEIMRRVRQNLETLAERWRSHGFTLKNPLGQPNAPGLEAALTELQEAKLGLTPTLKAFYRQVGWVDFTEPPPSETWPDEEGLDPIEIEDMVSQVDEIVDDDGPLVLFADPLLKFGISGVGDVFVQLPVPEFDPELWFEDGPLTEGDGTHVRLVPYLRETLLVRGGIGALGVATDKIDRSLLTALTTGLIPF